MENTKLPTSSEGAVTDLKDKPKSKKGFLLIISGVIIIALIALSIFSIEMKNKEDKLSSIDDTITTIDSLFNETEDIEKDLSDLPEDFLDTDPVSTEDIDDALKELDTQMKELEGLDTDFELEISDVGL